MKKYIAYISLAIFIGMSSCSSSGGEPPAAKEEVPEKAVLQFPENNTSCNEGTILSDTESEVTFRWQAGQNTDSYTLSVKNLSSRAVKEVEVNINEADVVLQRGTPYSWWVTSKSGTSSQTANSDTWKFYNAGIPQSNYAPFPAELLSPENGGGVKEGYRTLEWVGSDIDEDIARYEVFFDEQMPPVNREGITTLNTMEVLTVFGKEYFWKVKTTDQQGNQSESEVFSFVANEEAVVVGTGENLVADPGMDDLGAWNYQQLWTNADNAVEHGFDQGKYKFIGAEGTSYSNAVIWQEIPVEAGKIYSFDMQVSGEGNTNSWLEVYFGTQGISAGQEEYDSGGAQIYVKSFGDNESCGISPFNGSILEVAANGCPIPSSSLLQADGNVIFPQNRITANGTIFLVIKAGNYNGNFGTGIFVDDVVLKEVILE